MDTSKTSATFLLSPPFKAARKIKELKEDDHSIPYHTWILILRSFELSNILASVYGFKSPKKSHGKRGVGDSHALRYVAKKEELKK